MDEKTVDYEGLKVRETVAEAAKRIPQLPVRKGGVFRHPSTWTEEEDEVIAAGLRANIPLNVIGHKVNCERACLAKHIENTPDLRQLKIDCRESRIDQAEYQADRLVQAGNPSMIMFTLERLGKDRGWGLLDVAQKSEDESRIVFGEIPEEEVGKAEAILAKIAEQARKDENKVFESDPLKAEMDAEAIANGSKPFIGTNLDADGNVIPDGQVGGSPSHGNMEIPAESVTASPPPYGDEGFGDEPMPNFDGGSFDDPNFAFDDGGDSPFGG